MRSFLGITVHLLSDDMSLHSYLLDISYFTGKHTGDNIANHCLSVVDEFNIRSKITFVVTDNAANMIKAFKCAADLFADNTDGQQNAAQVVDEVAESDETASLQQGVDTSGVSGGDEVYYDLDGEEALTDAAVVLQNLGVIAQQRISCGIHTLQLVVIDGLKGANFARSIMSKASKLASLLHTTNVFSAEFYKVFNITIPATTNTRWNSVYLQLSAIAKLDATKLSSVLTAAKHDVCMFTRRELNMVKEVVSILEPAYTATLIMEEDVCQISVIAPTVTTLHRKWTTMLDDAAYSQGLVEGLLRSLERRFAGLFQNLAQDTTVHDESVTKSLPFGDLLYPVSSALDPDFRQEWLLDEELKCRVTGRHLLTPSRAQSYYII